MVGRLSLQCAFMQFTVSFDYVSVSCFSYYDVLLTWQAQSDKVDDPNTYILMFGESDVKYLVSCLFSLFRFSLNKLVVSSLLPMVVLINHNCYTACSGKAHFKEGNSRRGKIRRGGTLSRA